MSIQGVHCPPSILCLFILIKMFYHKPYLEKEQDVNSTSTLGLKKLRTNSIEIEQFLTFEWFLRDNCLAAGMDRTCGDTLCGRSSTCSSSCMAIAGASACVESAWTPKGGRGTRGTLLAGTPASSTAPSCGCGQCHRPHMIWLLGGLGFFHFYHNMHTRPRAASDGLQGLQTTGCTYKFDMCWMHQHLPLFLSPQQ